MFRGSFFFFQRSSEACTYPGGVCFYPLPHLPFLTYWPRGQSEKIGLGGRTFSWWSRSDIEPTIVSLDTVGGS